MGATANNCSPPLPMFPVLFILIIVLLVPVIIYNGLVRKSNAVDNAYYSIDVMLKKRYDLIPMLVETVKGYAAHEKELLVLLTKLRDQSQPAAVNDKVTYDNDFRAAVAGVVAVAEAYPNLKASEQFLRLQGAINEAEEQLAASRRFYNAAVRAYQDAILQFPGSMLAGMFNMKPRTYFMIPDEQKVQPTITWNR